ncbi:MAG: cytochrome C oxidase subunit IV family protein [Phycisphaerales bacterium]|nr:cytochrome C oxidase subunit IV family protein [Phycisphaerales bacterium]
MSGHHEHGAVGHIVPIRMLVATCAVLLVLTGVTVWVAKFDFENVHISEANILIAMGVATFKALLVCLIFMHLRWDRSFVSFFFLASVLFVGLFIGISLVDTHENDPAIIPGNSALIQQKLDALDAAQAKAAEASSDATHGHGDGGH